MNNELKNKTKQQLYSEVVKLRTVENNAYKENLSLKAVNERLNANLEIAAGDFYELRDMYDILNEKTKNYSFVVTALIMSLMVNVALLIQIFLK